MLISPDDAHNRDLVGRVHPPGWVNPTPADRYDLLVIGAGTAGLVAAAGAAGLGARVALVEKGLLGGDCLNYGCVPSKALIRAARCVRTMQTAGEFGIEAPGGVEVDFSRVMERLRRVRSEISRHDSAERFQKLGVDVFFGSAAFDDGGRTARVGQTILNFKKAVLCTGARPAIPPIPGLADAGFLTNETVFSLTSPPRRLAVIGGGPIGCELAQAFALLGSQVVLYEAGARLLPRDDPQAADHVAAALRRDGVDVRLNASIDAVTPAGDARVITARIGEHTSDMAVDAILVATGRAPNVDGMNLEGAGVETDQDGVVVDDRLRSTNRRIYAAGDVCSKFKFTHAADALARIVVQNALFFGRAKASRLLIPWCTYTSPEVAHVGLSADEAEQRGVATTAFVQPLADVDRARIDAEAEGFVKVHVRRGTDRIVGATIVAAHAGELISELTLAIRHGVGLKSISTAIHPYPTQAEAIRKLGDQFNRTRLTPLARWVLQRLLRLG